MKVVIIAGQGKMGKLFSQLLSRQYPVVFEFQVNRPLTTEINDVRMVSNDSDQ